VNIGPADVPKRREGLALPVALAVLGASGQLPEETRTALFDCPVWGDLSLAGVVRSIRGATCLFKPDEWALMPVQNGMTVADLWPGTPTARVGTVADLRSAARAPWSHAPPGCYCMGAGGSGPLLPAELRGLRGLAPETFKAMLISAVSFHVGRPIPLHLVGPGGSGKTMIVSRVTSILPGFDRWASCRARVETVTRLYDAAGLLEAGAPACTARPFRAPHHTVSRAGLVGYSRGGPGEVSLAHGGVLFLDDLPEFARATVDALREPLREGAVTHTDAHGTVCLPARALLVTSSAPCLCGNRGNARRACPCSDLDVALYEQRAQYAWMDGNNVVRLEPYNPHAPPFDVTSAQARALVETAAGLLPDDWVGTDPEWYVTVKRAVEAALEG
jgi:magnesium chelatase family protein